MDSYIILEYSLICICVTCYVSPGTLRELHLPFNPSTYLYVSFQYIHLHTPFIYSSIAETSHSTVCS